VGDGVEVARFGQIVLKDLPHALPWVGSKGPWLQVPEYVLLRAIEKGDIDFWVLPQRLEFRDFGLM